MKVIDCPLCDCLGTFISTDCQCLICGGKLTPNEFLRFYNLTRKIRDTKETLKSLVIDYVRLQETVVQKYGEDTR